MEWNDDAIARLRQLWAEGHSTAEIGRRMGVTKNAVVGKAHRLELLARPSPIRRDGPSPRPPRRAPGPRRITGPTLPSMEATGMRPVVTEPPPPLPVPSPPPKQAPEAVVAPARLPPVPSPAPRPEPMRPVVVRPVSGVRNTNRLVTCCWPIGEPGTRSFRFCDADALSGKPYCQEHAQLAYVKVRDRREEVA